MEIELFGDEDSSDLKLPASFGFANAAGPNLERAADLAARLISNMTKYEKIVLPEQQLTPIDGRIQEFVLEQLKVFVRNPPKRHGL